MLILTVVLGIGLAIGLRTKHQQDLADARAHYRAECDLEAERVNRLTESTMRQLRNGLNAIASLPAVRRLQPGAAGFDDNARLAVQAVYDNMLAHTEMPGYIDKQLQMVGKIYVVSREFDPDEVDPRTGQRYAPLLVFDTGSKGQTLDNPAPELDTFELRAIREQLAAMKSDPEHAGPMLSPEIVLSDNSRYSSAAPSDADRSGLVYSVPLRGPDGKLKGCVSGLILTRNLADLISLKTSDYYALVNPPTKFAAGSTSMQDRDQQSNFLGAPAEETFLYWARQAEPMPGLIYSAVQPLAVDDQGGHWKLWAGRPDEDFLERSDVAAADRFLRVGYLVTGVLVLGILAFLLFSQRASWRLAASEARQRAIVENAADSIITFTDEGRIISLNPAAQRLLGLPTTLWESFPELPRDFMESGQATTTAASRARSADGRLELAGRNPGGSSFEAELSVSRTGDVWTGIFRNVTERRKAQAELIRMKDAAESSNRAKSEFLANMSHEIRTPMNAILGMTRLALKSDLTAPQREYMTTVLSSGEALIRIIDDILDFSKIEARALELDPIAVGLRDLLDATLKALALRAHEKGLELSCRVQPEVPDAVLVDPLRLRQVLLNLVGNAVKFTERGEVKLSVRLADDGRIEFEIADTGIGIPPEKLDHIFGAFTQADASTTRLYGGTGLGLAITGRLVALMGGELHVSSQLTVGSRFWFRLPLPPAPLPTTPTAGSLAGQSALVVDDNATNRWLLEELLGHWGMKVRSTVSAAEALLVLDEGEHFAVILTDAQMPDMDGFAFVTALRQRPAHSQTVVMMLSSATLPGDAARCRELKVAGFLTKPIHEGELHNTLARCLNPAPTPPPVTGMAPLRVLLVEDNPDNQALASILLRELGHTVTLANDGREAVKLTESEEFDAVLMDVQMPHMDGFEATSHIRRRGSKLPIIALTAHAMKGDKDRCLAAGMDAYLSKPLDEAALANVLAEVLQGGSV